MFPLPLVVTVHDSKNLRTTLVFLCVIAIAALWVALLPMALKVIGTLALLLGLWYSIRPRPVVTLRCHKDGKLELKSGQSLTLIRLEEAPVILTWLTVLTYSQARQKGSKTLVLALDSTSVEDFRRLRVWLRWKTELVHA